MRSSIACARCRRSKIKCVNAGIDTTCRACESSGRECVYPTPAVAGGPKRDLASLADGDDRNPDWDGPKRQRRRTIGGSAKDPSKAAMEALDSSILTVKVWESLFDLFQSHFATLLPFLHPATFLSHIRNLSAQDRDVQPPSLKPTPSPLIPLGVLALTARFHPQLVAYHSPSSPGHPPNPLAASEYYATALRSRLTGIDASFEVPDLARIQALLMLSLHEWGMCRGKSAWLYVGMAIRLSQAMGLPYELENETPRDGLRQEADHFGIRRLEPQEQTSDDVIAQETKRRTFWACFTLDRCLSSGKYRPRMIRVKELNVQLPSDNAFAFGERVRTARLNEPIARRPQSFGAQGVQIPSIRQSIGGFDDKLPNGTPDSKSWSPMSRRKDSNEDDVDRWEVGAEESVVSRVIRIVRIWGSIAKWSCAGGRRTEQYPPWHLDSRFCKLRLSLGEFQDALSRNIQYSTRNTDTHIMYKTTLAPYTAMHVVYFLSMIVLHRSYIPFLPLRCTEPVGPLDEPLFPPEKVSPPDGFWRESVAYLFKAARQMIDLVVTCQERGVLVENPLVGFAIYNAAFIGIYASHFPHMDQEGMFAGGQVHARKALDILREMRPRLKMAVSWFRTLNRLHSYFAKVKQTYRRHSHLPEYADPLSNANGNGIRPVREGGPGGGLEEFKLLEKIFLDFGSIEDQLPDHTTDNHSDAGSSNNSNAIKSDPGDMENGRRDSWIPVNNHHHSSSHSPGMPPPAPGPGPDTAMERRPSLPLPHSHPHSRPSFSLPSLNHAEGGLPPPPTTLFNTSSPPTHPSITPAPPSGPPTSYPQTPSQSQYTTAPAGPGSAPNKLQPLHSILSRAPPAPPPSYSASLPPIASPHSGSGNGTSHQTLLPPLGATSMAHAPSHSHSHGSHLSASPIDGNFANGAGDPTVWSASLSGEDVLAFLEGWEWERGLDWASSLVTSPTGDGGWFGTLWAR